jgi:hypothetical protein
MWVANFIFFILLSSFAEQGERIPFSLFAVQGRTYPAWMQTIASKPHMQAAAADINGQMAAWQRRRVRRMHENA